MLEVQLNLFAVTLRRTLCAGFDPIHAVHLLQDLIRDSNIRTEPELPVPTEIRLLEDGTVCVCTPERTMYSCR